MGRTPSPDSVADSANIFIGNLNPTSNKDDLEDLFFKYGRINDIWVARKPPGFAFVFMDDPRDARDAVAALNGSMLHGNELRIEVSNRDRNRLGPRGGFKERRPPVDLRPPAGGSYADYAANDRDRSPARRRDRSYDRGDSYRDRSYDRRDRSPDRGRDRSYDRRDRSYERDSYRDSYRDRARDSYRDRSPPPRVIPGRKYSQKSGPRRTDYRVMISGLPSGVSWQDLKTLFRRYAEPGYVQVYAGGEALVEFQTVYDMEHVVKKLHDTKYEGKYISLKTDRRNPSKSKSRSRSRSRDGGKDTGGGGGHSRSRSRSRGGGGEKRRRRSHTPEKGGDGGGGGDGGRNGHADNGGGGDHL